MRIGCLQFAPQLGDVNNNLTRADEVLDRASPEQLDLLVLPELAFSGYNFSSLRQISPHLEYSEKGISSLWAKNAALSYDCAVIVGYPEKVDLSDTWPASPEYYNSAAVVNGDGDVIANYRKSHLYYTDETWALEGPGGFFHDSLPDLGPTTLGICMDLNPYRFEAPWDAFEFATFAMASGARLVVISMAWLTQESQEAFSKTPNEPDLDTLMYWVSRLEPIIRSESNQEIIVVFANRCGTEGLATYAGTSAVIGISSGEVHVYGILGRGETDLLVVDTEEPPFANLVYRPEESNVPVGSQESVDAHSKEEPIRSSSPNTSNAASSSSATHQTCAAFEATFQERHNPSYKRTDLTISLPQGPGRRIWELKREKSNQSPVSISGNQNHESDDHPWSQWDDYRRNVTLPAEDLPGNHEAGAELEEEKPSRNTESSFPLPLSPAADKQDVAALTPRNDPSSKRGSVTGDLAHDVINPIGSLALDTDENSSKQTQKWMAADDPEIAYIEGEDPQALFHDPDGRIGRWVQMIQSPGLQRKFPAQVQGSSKQSTQSVPSRGETVPVPAQTVPEVERHVSPKMHVVSKDSNHSKPATDLETVCQRLENIAQDDEHDAFCYVEAGRFVDEDNGAYQQHYARGDQRTTSSSGVRYHQHAESGDDVQGSKSDLIMIGKETSSQLREEHSQRLFNSLEAEPPILRPVSTNRLQHGREVANSGSHLHRAENNRIHDHERRPREVDQVPRSYSRGRKQSNERVKEKNRDAATATQRYSKTASNRRYAAEKPGDLAMDSRPESYPSPNGRSKGSRSRSRARRQSGSRHRSSRSRLKYDADTCLTTPDAMPSKRSMVKSDLGLRSSLVTSTSKVRPRKHEPRWIAQDARVPENSVSAAPDHDHYPRRPRTPVPMVLISK